MTFTLFGKANSILCMALALVGCSKDAAPPPPIAVEQAPAKLEEAFKENKGKQVDPEVKRLMDESVAALNSKDYAKALFTLQSLLARSDLTPPQRDLASRSMLAVNKALDEQASNGDKKAQEVLQFRRATK